MPVKPQREKIEWCSMRWVDARERRKPRILLIGDSIASGYSDAVYKQLKRCLHVDLLATSKALDDPGLDRELAYMLGEYRYQVVHFNNGLHGWHLPPVAYELNLRALVRKLRQKARDAQLIWAMSTPITGKQNAQALDPRLNAVVLKRNAVAAEIMKTAGIPVDDLYHLVVGRAELRANLPDPYHYNTKGNEVLGVQVTRVIRQALKAK